MSQFIRWYDDVLPKDLCREIVRRFDIDPSKFAGKVSGATGSRVSEKLKQTTELFIDGDGWKDILPVLNESLNKWLQVYTKEVQFLRGVGQRDLHFERPRLKRYDIGEQFGWHVDCSSPNLWERSLAAQWYFNNVAEGGATEFEAQGVAIPCVEGRLAFFPVSWTYRHRGAPPRSGPKYVCTTFLRPRWETPASSSEAV
ncbi:MAG: 2OG-Fe(II) oxygenase [Pseudomonadota bacterium]|nr:2OG-Fe(II) oxygenase [Pseudomonadota bacterium]